MNLKLLILLRSVVTFFRTPVATFSLGSIQYKQPTHILTSMHTHTNTHQRTSTQAQTIYFAFRFFFIVMLSSPVSSSIRHVIAPHYMMLTHHMKIHRPKQGKTTTKSFKIWTLGWGELLTIFFSEIILNFGYWPICRTKMTSKRCFNAFAISRRSVRLSNKFWGVCTGHSTMRKASDFAVATEP